MFSPHFYEGIFFAYMFPTNMSGTYNYLRNRLRK